MFNGTYMCLMALICCTTTPVPQNQNLAQSDRNLFDSALNKYIQDTLSPELENPASFQLIGYNNDTLTGIKSDKMMFDDLSESQKVVDSQRRAILADLNMDSIKKSISVAQLDSQIINNKSDLNDLKLHPTKPDSIVQINVNVKFKIKNKNGKEISDSVLLVYYPKFKKFTEVVGE